ncbi:hypothetical protein [Clostridium algidicarnis]|uniref:hypothetical protein n=1 Tax=Clostridium algidicarnis TaxID=37659 RepID=UPI001C0AE972|nr:hypothetical protein [Clostridium algidicarnis]MBU3193661.1 hypothetical protein [Clostridium algidicarnis]
MLWIRCTSSTSFSRSANLVSTSCCGLDVTSGNEAIDEYANSLGYTNINRNEIYLSGKNPYNEFAIEDGYYYYRNFRLYGELTRDKDEGNVYIDN